MPNRFLMGAFAIICGIGAIVFNWWYALEEEKFSVFICLMGPVFLTMGVGYLIFPVDRILHPRRGQGPSIGYSGRKMKPLGWFVALIGLALGGLQWGVMKYGWFLD